MMNIERQSTELGVFAFVNAPCYLENGYEVFQLISILSQHLIAFHIKALWGSLRDLVSWSNIAIAASWPDIIL